MNNQFANTIIGDSKEQEGTLRELGILVSAFHEPFDDPNEELVYITVTIDGQAFEFTEYVSCSEMVSMDGEVESNIHAWERDLYDAVMERLGAKGDAMQLWLNIEDVVNEIITLEMLEAA